MNKFKNMSAFWFVALGAIVTVLGAFFQEVEKRREKEKSLEVEINRNKTYEEIIQNQKETINSAKDIIDLQKKLEKANLELKDANNQILIAQEETIKSLKGGDAKPTLILEVTRITNSPLRNINNHPGRPFYLINFIVGNTSGKYSLKNVNITIDDFIGKGLSSVVKIKGTKSNAIIHVLNEDDNKVFEERHDHTFNLGTININDKIEIYSTAWVQPANDLLSGMDFFNIRIKTENGFYSFVFKLKEVDGKCILSDLSVKQNNHLIENKDMILISNNPPVSYIKPS